MVKKLTEKQQQYCKNIVAGMNQKDAYISAYNHTGNIQTAYNEASKLMLREDIQQYISTLKKPLEQIYNITILSERQQQINEIKERIKICKEKQDENSLIRYYDMLNKLYNLYKDNEPSEKQENTVSKLDTDTLLKLTTVHPA